MSYWGQLKSNLYPLPAFCSFCVTLEWFSESPRKINVFWECVYISQNCIVKFASAALSSTEAEYMLLSYAMQRGDILALSYSIVGTYRLMRLLFCPYMHSDPGQHIHQHLTVLTQVEASCTEASMLEGQIYHFPWPCILNHRPDHGHMGQLNQSAVAAKK